MKREELEKYIGELSPEMQEKARQCKDMKELNALLAENDVELSEDALKAVAGGGCTPSEEPYCEIIVEEYITNPRDPNTYSFRGARLEGAAIKKDNRGNTNYYIKTIRGYESTNREEFYEVVKWRGLVKV